MARLTVKQIQGKLKPGMHNDGAGLYLRVSKSGAKSWVLRCRVHGKKRDFGLGGISWVTLAEARDKAYAARKIAREGGDPFAERIRAKGAPTFEEAAMVVWHKQIEMADLSDNYKAAWIGALKNHVFPIIGSIRVDVIQSSDILRVLQPIWLETPANSRMIRDRMRMVFDWSIAAQHRIANNPIIGIERALPKQNHKSQHFVSMPYADIPGLIERLTSTEAMEHGRGRCKGVAALTVRYQILTAQRGGEVRGTRWAEIDMEEDIQTIPAEYMKNDEKFRIPLTAAALEVLEQVRRSQALKPVFTSSQREQKWQGSARLATLSDDLVFCGQNKGRPLSKVPQNSLLRLLNVSTTLHGFRSSFKDWSREQTDTPREIAEMCLAHTVGNTVEQAYARSDLIDKRRTLMEQWARFCCSATNDKA